MAMAGCGDFAAPQAQRSEPLARPACGGTGCNFRKLQSDPSPDSLRGTLISPFKRRTPREECVTYVSGTLNEPEMVGPRLYATRGGVPLDHGVTDRLS